MSDGEWIVPVEIGARPGVFWWDEVDAPERGTGVRIRTPINERQARTLEVSCIKWRPPSGNPCPFGYVYLMKDKTVCGIPKQS